MHELLSPDKQQEEQQQQKEGKQAARNDFLLILKEHSHKATYKYSSLPL